MEPRRPELVLVVTLILALPPAVSAENGSIAFTIKMVSALEKAFEPTLSYAPNGTIWYSGMKQGGEGGLWFADSDVADFKREADPPTSGGIDAVVHHDSNGRLFWAEMNVTPQDKNLQVGVRHTGLWTQTNFSSGDRPWFRTNGTGVTFLAFYNSTEQRIEVWKNTSGVDGWTVFSENASYQRTLADFTNHTDGTLYLMMQDSSSGNYTVSLRAPSDPTWTPTPEFAASASRAFGIPRVVVDLQKSLYVVYGENRSSQYAVWLRYFNGSTWSSPSKLSSDGKTGALPAAVAGIAGKVGAAWYQADGDFFPEEAPADTRWSVVYALFENSTGNLSLVQRVSVKDSVHKGPIGGGEPGAPFLGDFLYAARRQGDSTGRVAIGFVCDEGSLTEGCLASGITEKPLPFYAVQTEGPGVL